MAAATGVTLERRLALVIITHDRRREVLETTRWSLALPERPTVIVVDNGSTDGTADALERVAVAVPHERLIVVRVPDNIGAAARNLGVARTHAEYVAFADDDTQWQPGSLARAAAKLDACTEVAVITARLVIEPRGVRDPACELMLHSPLRAPTPLPGTPVLGFLAGACVMRRDAFVAAGGYEPRYVIGAEEHLLALDLASQGSVALYCDDLVVRHRPSPRRDTAGRRIAHRRNQLWSAWLRYPWSLAAADTVRALAAAARSSEDRLAMMEAVSGLPWALWNRRRLPRSVTRDLRLVREATGSQW